MRISDWSSDVCSSDLQISLPIFAALGAKRHRLLRRFHTFGHHLDAKIASQADDRGHDCGVVAQMRNVADEGTVDLPRVDRELAKRPEELRVGQACVSTGR